MGLSANRGSKDETQEEFGPGTTVNGEDNKDQTPPYVQTSQEGNMDEMIQRCRFWDIITKVPARSGFVKFGYSSGLSSLSSKSRQIAQERDEVSHSVASPAEQSSPRRFRVPFVRKINWASLKQMSWEWIKNPMYMALFVWIVCVAISGAILFMVMTGMLNHVLPRKSQRDTWFEVNNQILNALFTLMCLYQHPRRFHHLVLLCRWRTEDVLTLRKIYCKNGSYKPHEWMHMMVVVVLLHINCFAQYALCGLNLGFRRSQRPAIGVGICISVALAAPAVATVYNILSPLGKEYDLDTDLELQGQTIVVDDNKPTQSASISLEKKYYFAERENGKVAESRPQWVGGIFDFWDDISLAYLSLFCSFCVFGWNMDRLGFGNMYVHIATFILLCMAPFWIFNLAAVTVDNEVIREALGYTGIVLCVFGLLYGGFWRIQMRKRFNLPGNTFCCGNPAVTDCAQWLCCCFCSLSQEVRTADFYEIVKEKFYSRPMIDSTSPAMSPLPHEDGLSLFRSGPSSPLWDSADPSVFRSAIPPSPVRVHGENPSLGGAYITMSPPVPSVIQRENNQAV